MQKDQTMLRQTLALRDHPQLKIVDSDGRVLERLHASAALFRALSSDWEFQGNAKRIKAMRSLRPDRPYIACWRNNEAAVLPPGLDYWKSIA